MEAAFRIHGLHKAVYWTVILILSLLAPNAPALEWHNGDWQLHGFLSQGFTYTTSNQVFGTSRKGSFDFTELGINGSLKVLPNLLISGQGLYRSTGESDTQGLRLDFGQFDYNVPLLDAAATLGVRGGRVKIPFGLYNDTRDVIWTRPSVLLPQSVYFDTLGLRQAMIAADGGILYGRYTHGNHRFNLEFLTAEPQDNIGGAEAFLTGVPNVRGSLEGRPLLLGRAVYEWMGGRGKLMFSMVDLDRDFKSQIPAVATGNTKVSYPLFSGQYNAEYWSLTAEYGWIESRRRGYLPSTLKQNTSESFYVQGEYRLTEDWSTVLRYDVFHMNRDDPTGREGAELTGLPRHRFYARDLTVGVRWEFARNWLVAAEYHNMEGTAWLSTQDNPDLLLGGGDSQWNLFATMLSFRF